MARNGRPMRQLEYGGRGPRRRQEYEDYSDDNESVMNGGDYDLYDHQDSTVSYAVQLAMRDKEDQLVETALERIRRAQMLGKKNVKLSKREIDALERRRIQNESSGSNRRSRAGSTTSRPSSRRNGHAVPTEDFVGAYPPFAPGRPTSSSSNRPRTPTMQSLRPQSSSSSSPLRPGYPVAPGARPQSMQQPMYPRPLPDDPQWAPAYYNPMQAPYIPEQNPYQAQLPNDLRVGPQSRVGYPTGAPPVEMPSASTQRRQSLSTRPPQPPPQPRGRESSEEESEVSSEEESSSDDSDVQIVGVTERQAPGLQRRPVASSARRPRTSR